MGAGRRVLRFARRALLALAVLVALLVALVVATLAWLTQTDAGRAIVLEQALAIVNRDVLTGTLRVDRLEGPILGRLALRGATLADARGARVARIDSVEVHWRLRPLLRSHVEVPSVRIEGVEVLGRIEPDGGLNLARLVVAGEPTKPAAPSAWSVALPDIALDRGAFTLRDARNDDARLVVVQQLGLRAAFAMDPGGRIRIDLGRLEAGVAPPLALDTTFGVSLERAAVTIDGAELSATLGALAVEQTALRDLAVRIDLGDGSHIFERVDAELPALRIDPAEANAVVPGLGLREPLDLTASIAGPVDDVAATVTLAGPDGALDVIARFDLRTPATPGYSLRVQTAGVSPDQWLDLGLPAARAVGHVELAGRGITPSDTALRLEADLGGTTVGTYRIDTARIDVGLAARALDIRAVEVAAHGLAARIEGRAGLDGSADLRASVDAPDLSALRGLAPGLEELAGAVSLSLVVDGRIDPAELGAMPNDPVGLAEFIASRAAVTLDAQVAELRAPGASIQSADVSLSTERASPPAASLAVDARGVAVAGLLLDAVEVGVGLREERLSVDARVAEAGTGRTVSLNAGIAGGADRADIDLRRLALAVPPIAVALEQPARVGVDFGEDLAPTAASVEGLAVAIGPARIAADGRWSAAGAIEGNVTVRDVEIAEIADAIGIEMPAAGRLSLVARAAGTLARPDLRVEGALRDASALGVTGIEGRWQVHLDARSLDAEIDVDLDGAELVRLRTPAPGLPVRVDLERGAAAIDTEAAIGLTLWLAGVDVARFAPALPALEELGVAGVVSLGLALNGSIEEPRGMLGARLSDVRVLAPMPDGAPLELADLDLDIAADYGTKNAARASLRSYLSWEGGSIATLEASSGLDVRSLVEGTVAPDAWLAALEGAIVVSAGPLDVATLPRRVRELVDLRGGTVAALASWEGTPSRGALDAMVRGIQLRRGIYPPVDLRADVRADDLVQFDLRGAVNTPDLDPWEAIDRFGAASDRVEVAPNAAAARMYGRVERSPRSLLLEGFRPSDRLAARAHVAALPIEMLAPFVGDPTLADVGGVASGFVDLTGTPLAPALLGRVAARGVRTLDGALATVGVEVAADATSADVRVEVCGGDARLAQAESRIDWAASGPIVGEGWALRIPEPHQVALGGGLSIPPVQAMSLVPAFLGGAWIEDVDGRVTAALTLGGTAALPRPRGDIRLDEVDATIVPLGRSFEDVELALHVDDTGLVLRDLRVRDGAGRVTGEGTLALLDGRPGDFDARLRFRDFLLADATGNGVFVDGRLELTGGVTDAGLRGDVVLRDVTLTVPAQAAPTAGPTAPPGPVLFVDEDVERSELGAREPRPLGDAAVEVAETLPIDLHIETRGRNRVQHSLADVDFEIDLDAAVRTGEIALDGDVRIPRGRVTFAGKSFDLTRGLVQFDGRPNVIDPVIDVEAVHTLSGSVASRLAAPSGDRASVSVKVYGALSEVVESGGDAITMRSDPEMSKQDILFVLLTGRPREDDGAVGAEQQALATAGSLLLGLLGDRIADRVMIDTLRIEGDAQTGQAISRVEGGKYISEDVYVSGSYINSQDPEENDFEFSLEWIIKRFARSSIRTELRAGNRGKGSVELLYQFVRAGRRRAAPDVAPGE